MLLPGTSFFLMKNRYAPARAAHRGRRAGGAGHRLQPGLLEHRVDADGPGARGLRARLSIEEALTAATLNAACCLGLGDEIGSIEAGKRADLVLLDAPNLLHLAYHYGVNPVAAVVKGGRVAHRASAPLPA